MRVIGGKGALGSKRPSYLRLVRLVPVIIQRSPASPPSLSSTPFFLLLFSFPKRYKNKNPKIKGLVDLSGLGLHRCISQLCYQNIPLVHPLVHVHYGAPAIARSFLQAAQPHVVVWKSAVFIIICSTKPVSARWMLGCSRASSIYFFNKVGIIVLFALLAFVVVFSFPCLPLLSLPSSSLTSIFPCSHQTCNWT